MSRHMTKPTKGLCVQRRLSIRPVWSVFVVRRKKAWVLSYALMARWRLWSDWADAQADLSLRWAHRSFCWFRDFRWMDGWPAVFASFQQYISHSGRWKGEHERLCAMKRRLGSERISPPAGFEPETPWSEVGSAYPLVHAVARDFRSTEGKNLWYSPSLQGLPCTWLVVSFA